MPTRNSQRKVVTDPAAIRGAGERVLRYLAETDPTPTEPADAVIGFGVFDLRLPQFCADLFSRGHARRIVFTGGIGGGTGDLGGPEADVWRADVLRTHPDIPDHAFIIENGSTNTAENIAFTAELLAKEHPGLTFGTGTKTAIIVASPSRLRRVRLTMAKLQPAVRVTRLLPRVTFENELSLYIGQGVDYLAHLIGELDRIATYPSRGWIVAEPIPADVLAAGEVLRRADVARASRP
jgi:uncharacterized SAM-binding protein YcdF (DUF218 family)